MVKRRGLGKIRFWIGLVSYDACADMTSLRSVAGVVAGEESHTHPLPALIRLKVSVSNYVAGRECERLEGHVSRDHQ